MKETYNTAKTEHRNTKLTFKLTPQIQNIREKLVMIFYVVGNQQFLSCIDVYSKFATLVESTGTDWFEAKKTIMKVFNEMRKPQEIKADKDSAFMCVALHNWLISQGVQIQVTKQEVKTIYQTYKGFIKCKMRN